MKLSTFIRKNIEAILQEWEQFADSIQPRPGDMDKEALRDHAKLMLEDIADDLDKQQSKHEQTEKSKGLSGESHTSAALDHGLERKHSGFEITGMMSEYRFMRATVIRLWHELRPDEALEIYDLIRYNEAIDRLIYEAVGSFSAESNRQKRLFDMILSSDHGYILDLDGRFVYANHPMLHTLNISLDELVGKSHSDLHFSSATEIQHNVKHVVQKTEKLSSEVTYRFPSGEVRYFEYVFTPVIDNEKKIEFVAAIERDITERKKAEEEKIKLEGQLQQAHKMEAIGQLAGGVAHDFNNMLGVILGHADMAMNDVDPSSSLYADLEEIRKAAIRSADITRQLLAFARKQTVVSKVIDLNETIEGMLKMLRRIIGENIDLAWLPGAGLWTVKIDPSQIDQIMANLCVNARAAITKVGKITVETGNNTFDEEYCDAHAGFVPGEYARIVVRDNGSGIDRENLPHIFEPFFTSKGVGEGTGLGLATVHGAVMQNNGFINVYSEPGRGTAFSIYLPRHVDQAGRVRTENAVKPALRGDETILLVEDEQSILEMTRMMLERLGYTVFSAGTPREALRMASELDGKINLLLTDVVMPEMNGRDLAQNLLPRYPSLKCLFMSGYTSDIIAQQGILDEEVEFIQKPFSKIDLAIKVRMALEKLNSY